MARHPRWHSTLEASIQEARLAVRVYNDPLEPRAFEAFVVHAHLAWLYLLHAQFMRDAIDFRYWDPKHARRLQRVDGEPKMWELSRSIQERWPDASDPVRSNVALFIRLRNRLEHRHAQADAALLLALSGHSHALLLNFEQELTSQFGSEYSLGHVLRIPLFIGSFSPQGESALRRLRKSLPADLDSFLTEYESGLAPMVVVDPRYQFRLRAAIELAPKDADAVAMQFTQLADMTDEDRDAVEALGRRGQVIVRDRKQPVSGLGRMMPKAAAESIQAGLPFEFRMHHFVAAWKHFQARPEGATTTPDKTNPDWCEYHEPTKSYQYTMAFVRHVIKKCATADGFKEVTGLEPKTSATRK